jgi:transposase
MGNPYKDDLRRKLLSTYDLGEGTLEELAGRFSVSLGWAKKISAARTRTGQAERVPYHPGRKPAVGIEMHATVKAWFEAQPDLTLVKVQEKLQNEARISLCLTQISRLLRKLNVRLKRSRSTPPNKTLRAIANSAKSSMPVLRRSSGRRKA